LRGRWGKRRSHSHKVQITGIINRKHVGDTIEKGRGGSMFLLLTRKKIELRKKKDREATSDVGAGFGGGKRKKNQIQMIRKQVWG